MRMNRTSIVPLVVLTSIVAAAFSTMTWRDWLKPLVKAEIERQAENQRERQRYNTLVSRRTADELRRERNWVSGQSTECTDFGRGSAPQVCIQQLGSDSVSIGTPIIYRVRWRNLPKGAYIRVWSRNAAPPGERWKYMGAQGAVAPNALGGTSEGEVLTQWDGRSVYCAPSDLPMMCDNGEVGRFVLRAAIMTGTDPFWPSWPVRNPVPVIYHARSETRAFGLSGPPQPVARSGTFRTHPASQAVIEAIRSALPEDALGTDWYVERRVDHLQPWVEKGLQYCARLDLDAPLAGWIDVCFPHSRRDQNGIALRPGDLIAVSRAKLAPGLLAAGDAKRKASAYAVKMTGGRAKFSSYPSEQEMAAALHLRPKDYGKSYQDLRDKARDAGLTFVEVDQPYPEFRDNAQGSWWLVQLGLWVGTIDGPRVHDWGRIALRVDHDGHVCRVQNTGKREQHGLGEREVYSDCLPGTRGRI